MCWVYTHIHTCTCIVTYVVRINLVCNGHSHFVTVCTYIVFIQYVHGYVRVCTYILWIALEKVQWNGEWLRVKWCSLIWRWSVLLGCVAIASTVPGRLAPSMQWRVPLVVELFPTFTGLYVCMYKRSRHCNCVREHVRTYVCTYTCVQWSLSPALLLAQMPVLGRWTRVGGTTTMSHVASSTLGRSSSSVRTCTHTQTPLPTCLSYCICVAPDSAPIFPPVLLHSLYPFSPFCYFPWPLPCPSSLSFIFVLHPSIELYNHPSSKL